MGARWLDLLDPDADALLSAVALPLDPEAVAVLTERSIDARSARPLLEPHGSYVLGVTVAARPLPDENRVAYLEVDVVAAPDLLVTVRKTSPEGLVWDPAPLEAGEADGLGAGELLHRLLDDHAGSYLDLLDHTYVEVDELEDNVDTWSTRAVRQRLSELRHELLHGRKIVSATRSSVRRVVDGRIEVGDHQLFPREVELLFADTHETLVRATEELDVARELLASARDFHQSKVTETQGDVAKKLTVVASLLLLPTFIVGVYGQNFAHMPELDWKLGYLFSWGVILGTTALQLALFKWRKWI